jgi:hypothetical protein
MRCLAPSGEVNECNGDVAPAENQVAFERMLRTHENGYTVELRSGVACAIHAFRNRAGIHVWYLLVRNSEPVVDFLQ